jgi:putative hydrolase of the HAD superfamily
VEHDMQPDAFLDYVHQIDYSAVALSVELKNSLANLPGRKLIFTNGTTGHAMRVLKRLGIEDAFEGVFDIVDSDYIPKPDRKPYDKFAALYGIDTTRAAMFEDIDLNLEAPHDMGMTTVLITEDKKHDAHYVHHTTNDLAEFLKGVAP